MTPPPANAQAGKPDGALAQAIDAAYGSLEKFQEQFSAKAMGRFGSGWVWLVKEKDGSVDVVDTPNQDSPIMEGKQVILGLDVWEHAYYLTYQNRRADYIAAWWNLVSWGIVGERYAAF
jgi:Fe-Mn family superoxide dismutase